MFTPRGGVCGVCLVAVDPRAARFGRWVSRNKCLPILIFVVAGHVDLVHVNTSATLR